MENTQLILLAVAGLIVLCIVFFAIKKSFSKKNVESLDEEDQYIEDDLPQILNEKLDVDVLNENDCSEKLIKNDSDTSESASPSDAFMMISVHAKPGKFFSDYGFLQSMGLAGLVYGDHKIFHYDVKTDIGMQRLFSVAQLNNPGTFDIDHVENMTCKGLLMFIDLQSCRKHTLALDCMLEAAYQLSEDLDGIMFEGYNTPWQDDTPRALAQQLERYSKHSVGYDDNVEY